MKKYLDKAMTFDAYTYLIDALLQESKTTGPDQSEAMVGFGRLNRQRMLRLAKTVELGKGVKIAARSLGRRMIWLIITEGWCGDAAQNIPVIEKIAAESDEIETRYLLRDENLDLMDEYLTDGKRSIPKLIAIDAATTSVVGTWGSRPKPAHDLFLEMKKQGLEKSLIQENMQRWYNADKGNSIQDEFEKLLTDWNRSV